MMANRQKQKSRESNGQNFDGTFGLMICKSTPLCTECHTTGLD